MKLGYEVAPADANGKISIHIENEKTNVLGLRLSKDFDLKQEYFSQDIYDDISKVCGQLKVQFHSIIVSRFEYDTRWCSGNILKEKESNLLGSGKKFVN